MILLAKSDHLEEMPGRIQSKKVSNSPSNYLRFQCYHSPTYINKLWFSGPRISTQIVLWKYHRRNINELCLDWNSS